MPRSLSKIVLTTIFVIAFAILLLVPDKLHFLLFAPFELYAYYLAYKRRRDGMFLCLRGPPLRHMC